MSQHFFTTSLDGENIQVMMGWDRPLGGFFMMVEDLDNQGDDCYLFNNLDEDDPHPLTLDHYLDVLKTFGVSLPANMVAEVQSDQRNNVGNRVCHY